MDKFLTLKSCVSEYVKQASWPLSTNTVSKINIILVECRRPCRITHVWHFYTLLANHHISSHSYGLSIMPYNYKLLNRYDLLIGRSFKMIPVSTLDPNTKNWENMCWSWLVGGAITILKNMISSMGRIIYPIYEMENKKKMKPPTSWYWVPQRVWSFRGVCLQSISTNQVIAVRNSFFVDRFLIPDMHIGNHM